MSYSPHQLTKSKGAAILADKLQAQKNGAIWKARVTRNAVSCSIGRTKFRPSGTR